MNAAPAHASICERFGALPVKPAAGEKVGVALSTLGELPLNAMRESPEGGVCGWYIWGGELSQDPGFFQPLHVEHLAKYVPRFLPYVELPPGWRVQLAPNHEDVWFDPELLRHEG
jgi:hypothetical protein